MKRLAIPAAGLTLLMAAAPASADDSGQPACSMVSNLLVSQDKGTISIGCSGVTEAYGDRLIELLNQVLQHRLDPQMVIAKLDEIGPVPEEGKARVIDETQRQAIVQALVSKPSQEIAIVAHSKVEDAADYGKGIATPLLMVGWRIQGQEIKRAAPSSLDEVRGVAVLVHDKEKPPQKALLLRDALTDAHIVAPIVGDPSLKGDATTLWVGRRPEFIEQAQKP